MLELTRSAVCERLNIPAWRVEYLMQQRLVSEPRRVGRLRVWDESGVEEIRKALARLGVRR